MSLDSLIDEIIRDAMARGEFDHLPGAGKPLDHDAYFALPEDQRLAFTALKNSGYVPEEVDLLKEIKALKEKLAGSSDPVERGRLNREINDRTLKFNLLQEQKQHAKRKTRRNG
jgi:DnaJ homologue, subfamily C, member 28, conserved domain